jgi:hypothetical protein
MKYPAWSIASVNGAVKTNRRPPAPDTGGGNETVKEFTPCCPTQYETTSLHE